MVGETSGGYEVMPGDEIDLSVWAAYESGSNYNNTFNQSAMIGLIATSIMGIPPFVDGQTATDAVNDAVGALGLGGTSSSSEPAAYLNYYLFDKNLNFIPEGSGFKKTVNSNQGIMKEFTHSITVKESGYLLVFLSNESNDGKRVFFDELTVTLIQPIIQVDDYYPFGLSITDLSTTRENIVDQDFKYNGKELQDDFGLEWYDYGARMYEPSIGRWNHVDPLAENSISMTSYHYAASNPILFIDPNGMDWFVNNNNGMTVYIQGESEFSYDKIKEVLTEEYGEDIGSQLTSLIAKGGFEGDWENFGADDMFDTKENKISKSSSFMAMDVEESENFMNKHGFEKALEQSVEEVHIDHYEGEPFGPNKFSSGMKEILDSKVTYKKPGEFGETTPEISKTNTFGAKITEKTYRQTIRYGARNIKGQTEYYFNGSTNPLHTLTSQNSLKVGLEIIVKILTGKKKKK